MKQALQLIMLTASLALIASLAVAPAMGRQEPAAASAPESMTAVAAAFFARHCNNCHSAISTLFFQGWLTLDNQDLTRVGANPELWERVLLKLRSSQEPPFAAGRPLPDPAEIGRIVAWLEGEIDRAALPYMPAPGIHRLNRTEYGNALRDLLGLVVDPATLLPTDDSSYSFDNMANTLRMTPRQAQAFLAAADHVAGLAMADSGAAARIFVCRPGAAAEETPCARQIVTTLATNAFRRPPLSDDVDALMDVWQDGRAGGAFEDGGEAALRAILASPNFIYRVEAEPPDTAPGGTYLLTGFELASRLSFFLWSSIPDAELIESARLGRLQEPDELARQARRMLADPRADALSLNFAAQWLGVRRLPERTMAAAESELRRSMEREVQLFFDSIVQEDRSVLDLLAADHTFVDERLAVHYGIPDVAGDAFRRVTLSPELDVRRGLLGKAAILTATSRDSRNSIVSRGHWVQWVLLGSQAPNPPPDVQPLPTTWPGRTFRQVMEASLAVSPNCVACHTIMDPMGLALENFDRLGMWRTHEEGQPVDASATLRNGVRIDGPAELRGVLLEHSDQFVQTMIRRLLTYALGRGATHADMPLIRSIARDAAAQGYRFSAIVEGIVRSDTFRMNAGSNALP